MMTIDGRASHAIGVNGTVPAPLIRLKQGTTVRLSVTNDLDEDSSIHWHGLLVPAQFDGVPGISFPGIRSEEHTSELQSLMRISYAVFCLKKKTTKHKTCTSQLHTERRQTLIHKQEN